MDRRDVSLDEVYQLNDEGLLIKGSDEAALAENQPSLYKSFWTQSFLRHLKSTERGEEMRCRKQFRVKREDLESFLNEKVC